MDGTGFVQSALRPVGSAAADIQAIGYVLLVGSGLVFLLVLGLTLYVLVRPAGRPRPVGGSALLVGGGLVLPVGVLTGLLLYTLPVTARLAAPAPADALRIEVIGRLWWWDVRYLDAGGEVDFSTANEVTLPVGRPIEFRLRSDNVIHSFWIPSLAGKMDMIPGRENRLVLQADRPAVVRGQCAEFCGAQHAWMALDVAILPADAFEAWAEGQRRPVGTPWLAFLARGRDVFVESGCGACHRLRGIEGADGEAGPDLTHVGSRATIAAGLLPANVGGIAGWIVNPQVLKPGVLMPAFDQLPGPDLRALAAWLASLE